MSERKNKRAAAFVDSVASYTVTDGDDFRVSIDAKDFPARGVFKVYRVHGDITKLDRLKAAINNLLVERGLGQRRVHVSL